MVNAFKGDNSLNETQKLGVVNSPQFQDKI